MVLVPRKRLIVLRVLTALAGIPILSSCSGVKFALDKNSPQAFAALCGTDGTSNIGGPKITSPLPEEFVRSEINLEGTCVGTANVDISGGALNGSASVACVEGNFSLALTLKRGDGMKDLEVTQAGVPGRGRMCVTMDTTPPQVQIIPPASLLTNHSPLQVNGICESGLDVQLAQDGSGLPSVIVSCVNGRFSGLIPATTGDGPKVIVASQTDRVGNSGKDDQHYILDLTPPSVDILSPLMDTSVKNSVVVSGTCEADLTVTIEGTGPAAPVSTACTGGRFLIEVPLAAVDGARTLLAGQVDQAGNRGSDQVNVIRDTTAPLISITAPIAGFAARSGVTLEGKCTDGLPVEISGPGVSAASTANCNTGTFSAAVNFSSGDGTKSIVASQTDGAGNTGSDRREFVRDNAPPAVRIANPAPGTATRSTISLSGTCETGLMVNLNGAIVPAVSVCASGQFSATVTLTGSDGAKNIVASQTDSAGNSGSDNRSFNLLTSAPAITITAPAANTRAQAGVLLTGTCTNGLPIAVSGPGVNASGSATCGNGLFSTSITFSAGDGIKNVIVSQIDAAGNTGSDNRNFVRDTAPPAIAITSPAAGTQARTGVTLGGTCTDGLPVSISGAVNSASTTACAGGAFSAAITFSAGDGVKSIAVSQTDEAGNKGSDSREFVRNNIAPAIQITAPAPRTASQGPLTVSGSCSDALPVNLNGDVAAPVNTSCSGGRFSAVVILGGADGVKTVVAAQTDVAGNTGRDSREFLLDTTAPLIRITSPAAGAPVQTGLTVTGTCESGLPVNVAGPGGGAQATVDCTGGRFSAAITLTGADGTKTVVAAQTDGAGNTGRDSRNFVLDTTAPIVKFTSPDTGTTGRTGLTVSGTCESSLTVHLAGPGIGTPGPVACVTGAFSASITFSVGDGSKTITASQTDATGNAGSDSRVFNRDATAPVITINSPAAGAVTRSEVTLAGECETGLPVNISGGLAPGMAVCLAGNYTAQLALVSPDGTKSIMVSQTDGAGNTGIASRSFVLDATGPAVRITGPAAGGVTKGPLTLAGTCESGAPVSVTGGIVSPVNTSCIGERFSAAVVLAGADGVKNVVASQTDGAGNTGADNRNFQLDATAPAIRITSPTNGTITTGSLNVTGVCESGLQVQLSGAGIGTPGPVACSTGQFSASVTLSNGDGNKVIVASQTDTAGNSGSDTRSFVKDATVPVVRITQPLANAVSTGALTLVGTCETGLTVTIGGAVRASTTSCPGGQFNASVSLTGSDGVKRVTVAQTDGAGNTGNDIRDFILDTTAPNVTITSPSNGSDVSRGFTLTGVCEAGLALYIRGDLAAETTTTCPAGGNYSVSLTASAGNGAKHVYVSQTDLAGHTGDARATFTVRGPPTATETFTADEVGGKVDILFVDDNSASMEGNESNLGAKFSAMTSALKGVDWQAGITTTDCSAGKWGICGSLLTMDGTAAKVLNAQTPNYATVFSNTIVRPETVGCVARGECPSGDSVPLKATLNAFVKHKADNASLFRDGADVAVVILTNSDENNNRTNANSVTARQVIDGFTQNWGTGKKLRVYSIVILPGDQQCLNSQRASGSIAEVGTYPINLARQTGGISVSICAPDYSVTLNEIGSNVKSSTAAVTLAQTPIAGSVTVTFTPTQRVPWRLKGNVISFDGNLEAGTQISVTYQY